MEGSATLEECSGASVLALSGVAGERAIATCSVYSVLCDDVYVLWDEFKEGQRAWNKWRRRCSTGRAEGRMMKKRGREEGEGEKKRLCGLRPATILGPS